MPRHEPPCVAFEVGTFVCPKTRTRVPLSATHSVSDLQWPVVVERCPACGERHTVEYNDLRHPPVFGYE